MKTIVSLFRKLRSRRAFVSIWTIILLPVLIGLIGLALDQAYIFKTAHELQNAADAAALAGAAQVHFNQPLAISNAVSTAAANKAAKAAVQLDSAKGDVVVGSFDRPTAVFTAGGPPYNAVKVTARRTAGSPAGPLPLIFAPIFGIASSNVSRTAIAMAGGTFSAGLVVLDPSSKGALSTNGNVSITVLNGGIQVNSSDAAAVSTKGSSLSITATEMRVNGGISSSGHPTLPAQTFTNTTSVGDPLAALPPPLKTDYTNFGSISVTAGGLNVTANPGYYPNGIKLSSSTSKLTLNPGVYLIGSGTNSGLTVSNGTFTANGVMFYMTSGTTPTKYGTFALSGGHIQVSPPSSGTYANILIFADRNTPSGTAGSLGGGATNLTGTLYLPTLGISLQGNAGLSFPNQIIAATISMGGNPDIIIPYNGTFPVTINNVFLVQ